MSVGSTDHVSFARLGLPASNSYRTAGLFQGLPHNNGYIRTLVIG